MELKEFFIDVTALPQDGYGLFQIICIGLVYAYILCYASNLISDGSELLLLVPAYAALVGSVVIPVLGAVPDGCIVLFSGMGENAEEELGVGVGVLAGSTIMILTLPWFLSILGGRVDISPVTNVPNYATKLSAPGSDQCTSSVSLFKTGISISNAVKQCGHVMVITASAYVVMQLASLIYIVPVAPTEAEKEVIQAQQSPFVLVACIICWISLCGYLYNQVTMSGEEGSAQVLKRDKIMQRAIEDGKISLLGLMSYEFKEHAAEYKAILEASKIYHAGDAAAAASGDTESTPLRRSSRVVSPAEQRIQTLLRPFFLRYDADKSGFLDVQELASVFRDLGESVEGRGGSRRNTPTASPALGGRRGSLQLRRLRSGGPGGVLSMSSSNPATKRFYDCFTQFDTNGDGRIDFHEFVLGTVQYIWDNEQVIANYDETRGGPRRGSAYQIIDGGSVEMRRANAAASANAVNEVENAIRAEEGDDEDGDDEEEEEEVPDDLAHLSPEEQQTRIKSRAFFMLSIGTIICFIISDPMVDVFTEVAHRVNISPFYVTFLLAPLASNATELIAAYNYAQKKTSKSITISLSTLYGAACLNNTFSLGIFLFILWYKKILSNYFAEFAAIVAVQVVLWFFTTYRSVHTLWDGALILTLFPLSLVLVGALEWFGWS